jgi:glycopeptide antibiotics resistance protein
VGFLYRLTTKQAGAFLLGAGISFSIETIQLFIPARTPSIIDILANALGTWLGAILYALISARIVITQGMLGRLRLETPLMGLVYLLIPLLG